MNERIIYIDILKAFAIMSVVYSHISYNSPDCSLFQSRILTMWHVPLFFVLSGFFVRKQSLCCPKSFLISKWKSIYIKGLYYFIPAVLFHNLCVYLNWYSPEISNDIVYGDYLSLNENIVLLIENVFLMNREPIIGPMWFCDVLFLAMTGLCIVYYILIKIASISTDYKLTNYVFFIIVIFLVIISNVATNIFGLTFTKVNNTISAMGLIILGQELYETKLSSRINWKTFVVALICLYQYSILDGTIALYLNVYTSFVQLFVITVSAYYTLAYVARKVENSKFGAILSYIGGHSFSIMGLHFVGFKICTYFLNIVAGEDYLNCYLTTPNLGNNYIYVFAYFIFGIVCPIIIVSAIQGIRNCRVHK